MDRGAWLASVHGVTKSQTRLSNQYTDLPRKQASPEMSCSASVLLPFGASVCIFCARTNHCKLELGHMGAILARMLRLRRKGLLSRSGPPGRATLGQLSDL